MKRDKIIICDINDSTFNLSTNSRNLEEYRIRTAARGILIYNNKIALLNVSKRGYHKFPGGGIDNLETPEEAFKREALEEAGCKCEIIHKAGITLEYRDQIKLVQISYIYMAKVMGKPSPQCLEQGEIDDGHDLGWYTLQEAIDVMKNETPKDYTDRFIHFRDTEIVKFYTEKIRREHIVC